MALDSPADALGSHASTVLEVVTEVVPSRHDHAAEAHQAAATRYSIGFGSQWRDLLDDSHDALVARGFPSHKLLPAGYRLPVVNDCLVYVWRIPDSADPSLFASSPTKKNGFNASPPDPMLFDPSFMEGADWVEGEPQEAELASVVRAVGDTMPLVLVMVQSSPRQLQSIDWALAELDAETGQVKLRGQESIWEPELVAAGAVSDGESFDSGTPVVLPVEPRKQEGMDPNE